MQSLLVYFCLASILIQDVVVETDNLFILLFNVPFKLLIRNQICRSHCKAVCHQPVIHDSLGCCYKLVCGIRANLQPN